MTVPEQTEIEVIETIQKLAEMGYVEVLPGFDLLDEPRINLTPAGWLRVGGGPQCS